MSSKLGPVSRLAAAATLACAALTGGGAHAGVLFDYSSFAGLCGMALTCVGNTAVSGTDLRLTPATGSQSGAGYSTSAITLGASATFSTRFQFRITDSGGINPADGLTFVVTKGVGGLGDSGGGLGYQGVLNSVAIEFDTYDNGVIDGSSSNHVGVDTNGNINSVFRANPYGKVTCDFGGTTFHTAAGCMSNGNVWTVVISYDGSLLDVTVQDGSAAAITLIDDYAIDIASILGTTTAFVGFTSGTGGGWGNHDILNWKLANDTSITPGVPEPGSLALVALALLSSGIALRKRQA
jgi:Legume lectin domain/PEP-CTERM motif